MIGTEPVLDLVAATPVPDLPLDRTPWRLTTVVDGATASSVPAGTTPTLAFDLAAGSVNGNGGCNDFGGVVVVEDGTMTISEIVSTEMACEEAVMRLEGSYFDILGATVAWEVDGTSLRLGTGDDRGLVFTSSS